ncbi:MAG: hypothetical protein ACOH5I_05165 [Oligoflexus sp.]
MCSFCSASFRFDIETGHKEVFADHYIISNLSDANTIKELALEWLRRLHHKPGVVDKEFFVVDIQGFSMPNWVVSMEAHTAWKGLVKRQTKVSYAQPQSAEYLIETGQFRRGYRWAVSARQNICESWGLTRLHEPQEPLEVEWDGFPLDSTLTRGQLVDEDQKPPYEARNFFEFKYANGLPILGVQVTDDEALRRAKSHVELYHYKLARLGVDYLIDHQTELEIAGVQLIHIPIWRVSYIYRPRNMLRYFFHGQEKRLIIDGYGKGVLLGELAMVHQEKVAVNAYISGLMGILFLLFGLAWHPAFLLVSFFAFLVAGVSFYRNMNRKQEEEIKKLESISQSLTQDGNHKLHQTPGVAP